MFAQARLPNRPHTVKSTIPSPDDPTAMLAALGELAALCGQALEAASVGAADPQLRALLIHRANLQRRAAADLSHRAVSPAAPSPHGDGAAHRERPGDTPLQLACRRAGRSVAACGALLRSELEDPMLRPLLIRYYHEAADLLRVLEQLSREHYPATTRRSPSRPVATRPTPHR